MAPQPFTHTDTDADFNVLELQDPKSPKIWSSPKVAQK